MSNYNLLLREIAATNLEKNLLNPEHILTDISTRKSILIAFMEKVTSNKESLWEYFDEHNGSILLISLMKKGICDHVLDCLFSNIKEKVLKDYSEILEDEERENLREEEEIKLDFVYRGSDYLDACVNSIDKTLEAWNLI